MSLITKLEKEMEVYRSINDLIKHINELDFDEWIYANPNDWMSNPKYTNFYYIPEKFIERLDENQIYLDDEEMEMPLSVKGIGLRTWMLISNLKFILESSDNVDQFISDINYYREFDTFRE